MGAIHVYYQLQELFPQVDPRILKAVSIEHPRDCDSAAEFVINDVLPTLGQPSKLHTESTRGTNEESCYKSLLDEHREQNTSGKQLFEPVQQKPTHQEYGDLCDSANVISNSVSESVNLEQDNSSSVYIIEHMSTPAPHPANSVTPSSNGVVKATEPIEIIDVEISKHSNHNPSSFAPSISEAEGKSIATIELNEAVTVEPTIFVSHDVRRSGAVTSRNSTNSLSCLLKAKGKQIMDVDACYHHSSSNSCESMAVGTVAPENVNTIPSGHEKSPKCYNVTSSFHVPSHSAMAQFNELTTKYDNGANDGCQEHLVKPLANDSEPLTTSTVDAEKALAIGDEKLPTCVNAATSSSCMHSSHSAMEKFLEFTEVHPVKPLASGSELLTTEYDAAEKALTSGHGKLPTCSNTSTSSSYTHSTHSAVEKFLKLTMKHGNGTHDCCKEDLVKPLADECEPLTIGNDDAEKPLPKLFTSRSGHVVNIDLLEDCVADAKSSKTDLVLAVESVINMVKEAEFLEEKCIQAKHEASNAGEEILAKVDELKDMLQRAKQANDMHAGEVFGEKSILLTEARELQSRLLNLADEKDKSLSLIEQMRESLETRLEAARNEILAAEKEKVEKKGFAVKALMEQEAIMESVVQEAKRLKEASEENAKLREFLDDRGKLVDTLEGEIAVIFEDVTSLKRRVDNVNSLDSSQSSSFSDKSTTLSSSEVLPEEQQSLSKKNSTSDFMQELESFTNTNCRNVAGADASLHEKSLSDDDDWEILRNEVGQF